MLVRSHKPFHPVASGKTKGCDKPSRGEKLPLLSHYDMKMSGKSKVRPKYPFPPLTPGKIIGGVVTHTANLSAIKPALWLDRIHTLVPCFNQHVKWNDFACPVCSSHYEHPII